MGMIPVESTPEYGNSAMKRSFSFDKDSQLAEILFGMTSGIAGQLIEYPFDTIKVHLQASEKLTLIECTQTIWKKEGVKGLFNGMSAPLVGSMMEQAVLFWSYSQIQKLIMTVNGYKSSNELSLRDLCVSGGISGAAVSFVLTPIELLKCRLQTQSYLTVLTGQSKSKHISKVIHRGPTSMFFEVLRWQGITGLYQGHIGTMLREIAGGVAWFGVYELSTRRMIEHSSTVKTKDDLSAWQLMSAGALAGMSYNAALFPADVVKSRMQSGLHGNDGFFKSAIDLYRTKGGNAFFRGFGITVLSFAEKLERNEMKYFDDSDENLEEFSFTDDFFNLDQDESQEFSSFQQNPGSTVSVSAVLDGKTQATPVPDAKGKTAKDARPSAEAQKKEAKAEAKKLATAPKPLNKKTSSKPADKKSVAKPTDKKSAVKLKDKKSPAKSTDKKAAAKPANKKAPSKSVKRASKPLQPKKKPTVAQAKAAKPFKSAVAKVPKLSAAGKKGLQKTISKLSAKFKGKKIALKKAIKKAVAVEKKVDIFATKALNSKASKGEKRDVRKAIRRILSKSKSKNITKGLKKKINVAIKRAKAVSKIMSNSLKKNKLKGVMRTRLKRAVQAAVKRFGTTGKALKKAIKKAEKRAISVQKKLKESLKSYPKASRAVKRILAKGISKILSKQHVSKKSVKLAIKRLVRNTNLAAKSYKKAVAQMKGRATLKDKRKIQNLAVSLARKYGKNPRKMNRILKKRIKAMKRMIVRAARERKAKRNRLKRKRRLAKAKKLRRAIKKAYKKTAAVVFKSFPDAPSKLKRMLNRKISKAVKRFGKNKKALKNYLRKQKKLFKKKVRQARIKDSSDKIGSLFPGASSAMKKKFDQDVKAAVEKFGEDKEALGRFLSRYVEQNAVLDSYKKPMSIIYKESLNQYPDIPKSWKKSLSRRIRKIFLKHNGNEQKVMSDLAASMRHFDKKYQERNKYLKATGQPLPQPRDNLSDPASEENDEELLNPQPRKSGSRRSESADDPDESEVDDKESSGSEGRESDDEDIDSETVNGRKSKRGRASKRNHSKDRRSKPKNEDEDEADSSDKGDDNSESDGEGSDEGTGDGSNSQDEGGDEAESNDATEGSDSNDADKSGDDESNPQNNEGQENSEPNDEENGESNPQEGENGNGEEDIREEVEKENDSGEDGA